MLHTPSVFRYSDGFIDIDFLFIKKTIVAEILAKKQALFKKLTP
jgi:hypothetical protein